MHKINEKERIRFVLNFGTHVETYLRPFKTGESSREARKAYKGFKALPIPPVEVHCSRVTIPVDTTEVAC